MKKTKIEQIILENVENLIIENLGIAPEKISEKTRFIDDLGCDSIATVELVMAFEEEFECEISDEEAQKLLTIDDVVKFKKKLNFDK